MSHKKWTIKRILKAIWLSGALVFTFWLFYSYQSKDVNKALLQNSETIKVEQSGEFYSFAPVREFKEVLIFFLVQWQTQKRMFRFAEK